MKRKEYELWLAERNVIQTNLDERIKQAREHPNYKLYDSTVDSLMDSSNYESGTIVGISPTREGFNYLHENCSSFFRGGFMEIKVGKDYIIYGFEFD